MNQNLRVNKTNFHVKGFALGLALKQRRNATWPILRHNGILVPVRTSINLRRRRETTYNVST